MNAIVTQIIRSEKVESIHKATAVVTNARGEIIQSFGDPELQTYVRSSAKPLQAMAVIRSGAFKKFGLTEKELAAICSSHSGEAIHTDTVHSIFNKAGLSEDLLSCGVHPPIDKISAHRLQQDGEEPQQIHNNCSGKHAGMLCTCAQWGENTENYLDPEHPSQTFIHDIVCEYTGETSIHRGIDGCSAPVFYLSLSKLARSFAAITEQETDERKLVFRSMTSNPYLVGGNQRFDTALMESFPGRIMSKGGAEAVSAAGFILPDGQVYGLAIKVMDGNYRVIGQMVLSILKEMGFIDGPMPEKLSHWWTPAMKNHAQVVVGTMKTSFE
ncbi:MAG: asparaginase [Candidatus Marinimicrobia bacterium]|nr:asparaginase [Candidatus Neomarinimicrobiota bacterium]